MDHVKRLAGLVARLKSGLMVVAVDPDKPEIKALDELYENGLVTRELLLTEEKKLIWKFMWDKS